MYPNECYNKEHKDYNGINPPKTLCVECWRFYIHESDYRIAKAREEARDRYLDSWGR